MRVLFSQGIIAISKPRCGSTSVRLILDQLVDPEKGDIAVDEAGQRLPYHPHHTAPYLKQLLRQANYDISEMTTIIFTRNPVDMLWSYFNYFKPDKLSRYSFHPRWNGIDLMEFEEWILRGRVGMDDGAFALAPNWINTQDLTPLSLEAHINTKQDHCDVDLIFRIEKIDDFMHWLNERTGEHLLPRHFNGSGASAVPTISSQSLNKVRQMFPMECEMYSI